MNRFFTNARFYPQNFLICGSRARASETALLLAREAACIAPEAFNGTESVFSFQLRYCPPYEQRLFTELKRLQAEAIRRTRFKDEYRGMILLDLQEWVDHADEELFCDITVPFLADMATEWHYIFAFDDLPDNARILSVLSDAFWFRDISDRIVQHEQQTDIVGVLQKEGITFFGSATAIAKAVFESLRIEPHTSQRIVRDFVVYFGTPCVIREHDLTRYIKEDTYLHALLKKSAGSIQKIERESA